MDFTTRMREVSKKAHYLHRKSWSMYLSSPDIAFSFEDGVLKVHYPFPSFMDHVSEKDEVQKALREIGNIVTDNQVVEIIFTTEKQLELALP